MPFITTSDQVKLYYEEVGAGKPLLFVHGWSLSSQIWSRQKEYFASRYRCIVFDLRGHGRSQPSCSGYGIEALAADVTLLFDHLELAAVTLFGWSLGSLVALAAYPAVRDRLTSLVLVSGTAKYCSAADYPHGLPPKEPRSLSLLLRRNPRKALDGFLQRMFFSEEQSERGFKELAREVLPKLPVSAETVLVPVLQTLETADMRSVLATITEPALLVHGDRDVICPADASRFMAGQISGAHCTILAGAGHAPMYSRPREFNSVIDEFLEKIYG
ncbi:MAG: alpha/beta hydrolase [Deltaproteobacteria bacterium]|nr:alpha/beta hydrolase [Deltaproteobacteria bacterium]TLN04542.1 MAG: alpha/beta hydrolase [bacterium]